MPRSHALPGMLVAAALVGCPDGSQAPAAGATAQRAPGRVPHAWPPAKGELFPALALLDAGGRTVTLGDFAGKVVLLELVDMADPGCQAFAGGHRAGGFGGVTPRSGVTSVDELLEAANVDPRGRDLVRVQVLFFDAQRRTPGVDDARAWTEHFWPERDNVVVLLGDERYAAHASTRAMTPGFFLIDRGGWLKVDASRGGGIAPDDLRGALVPALAELVAGGAGGAAEVVLCPPHEHPERAPLRELQAFRAAVTARDFARLDAELDRLAALGRLEGSYETHHELALDQVTAVGDGQLERLDAWVRARPRSAWARAARGDFYKDWAWDARGGGYADTVSDEGWRLFGERLRRARADLDAAIELGAGQAATLEAATVAITVARGLNLDRAAAERYFAVAQRARLGDVRAHVALLTYLMPKWHGDEESMWTFALGSVKRHPDEPALQLLVDEAHDEMARLSRDREAYERKAARELDAAHAKVVARYPRARESWRRRASLARLVGDDARYVEHGLQAAEAGDVRWQRYVAQRLLSGEEPDRLPRDVPRGLRFLCRAAESQDHEAEAELGKYLAAGAHGLRPDPARGVELLGRAAEGGSVTGLCALAELHVAGVGVARDLRRAATLYERAVQAADGEGRKKWVGGRLAELTRRGGPRGRAHPGGFDDWYPEDVSPPAGQRYPCALVALPRDLTGVPAAERRFLNHLAAVCLDATRSKLVFFRELRWDPAPTLAIAATRADLGELRALLADEPPPAGLESVKDDVLAALDLELKVFERFSAAMLPVRTTVDAQADEAEANRVWNTTVGRVLPAIPQGRQASSHLKAAWAALSARYGATWAAPVKDAVFHHLCALDLY